jgi:hypothetical protein
LRKHLNNNNININPIYYLSHAFNNSFPNINLKFTTTKEIENIIKSLVGMFATEIRITPRERLWGPEKGLLSERWRGPEKGLLWRGARAMEQAASGSCGLIKIAGMSRADVAAAAAGEPVGRAGGKCRASVECELARVAARLDRIPLGSASAVERRAVER